MRRIAHFQSPIANYDWDPTAHRKSAIGNGPWKHLRGLLVAAMVTATSAAGCSSLIDPTVPEPIRRCREPEFGGEYLLYRASHYDRDASWPLIILCPSRFPDSPTKCVRAWTRLAESFGFLVAAPQLEHPGVFVPRDSAGVLETVRKNEARILSTVRHIQAGHNISEDRILLYGWSAGAAPALYTGLRHPDLFRAVAVSQPRYDGSMLAAATTVIDPHQPVFVHYDDSDLLTGKYAASCADALRRRGVQLTEDRSVVVHEADTAAVVDFYLHILRTVPWIRLRALPGPPPDPLEIQFKLRSSLLAKRLRWNFGDGLESDALEPIHRFAAAGTYRVSLEIYDADGRVHRRSARLTLPEGGLQPDNRMANEDP